MRTLLYQILILLAIIGLITMPPVLTGYAEIERAQSVTDNVQKARHYERAARLLPWRVDLWGLAGEAIYASGNSSDSIPYLEKARDAEALSGFGWDILAHSYWISGDHETALNLWENGLEQHPQYFEFYSRLGMAYRQKGDFAAERDAIENWLVHENNPGVTTDYLGTSSAAFHYRFGQLLSVADQDRALEEFLLASSLDPEYDSTVETMRTTLNLASLETDESSKLVIVGRGLGLVGEWSLAAEAFRQAVAADGENAEAWAWLGEAEQQFGQDGRAELDKALALERTNPIVRSLRGLYWMRQDRGDQALAEYLLAAEYDPDNPAWQISIGDAYAQRGDLQAALGAYFRATEMDPTDADIWLALAAFSTRYNVQVEDVGLPAARMAVELSGEDPLALDMLGWTQALLGRYEQSQAALEHALELDPGLALAYLHLGMVAMQLDDWSAAHNSLLQARDLDLGGPVGEQAQLLLNQYFP
jgi:tetratricopeptide (TPR) repeat protein